MTAEDTLPVRKVAEATGIPPATLRVWERRYGRPRPSRTASGQRRYDAAEVSFLRLVAEGLKAGYRARRLLGASEEELQELLQAARGPRPRAADVEAWIQSVLRFDDAQLARQLLAAAQGLSLAQFLDLRLGPFLETLGVAWAEGRLDVRHEHLASAAVGDVLIQLKAARRRPPIGAPVLLATLPGEHHGLGLAMVAAVLAEGGVDARSLGPDTPLEEIVRAAGEIGARAVAISVSLAHAGVTTERTLSHLRAELDPSTELWIGGKGLRSPQRVAAGVRRFADLGALAASLATGATESSEEESTT